MTDFPTLSYTSNHEILTLSYTWSVKKVPFSGGASLYRPLKEVPPRAVRGAPKSTFLVCKSLCRLKFAFINKPGNYLKSPFLAMLESLCNALRKQHCVKIELNRKIVQDFIFHRILCNVQKGELYITLINTDLPLTEIQVYKNLA